MPVKTRQPPVRAGRSPEDLKKLVESIEKEHTPGVISFGTTISDAEGISTGSLLLDHAIGIGGVPRGRVTEIYGYEAAGKSTLAFHVMANAIKDRGAAAYIDVEHALDPVFAAKCGLNIDHILYSQPDSAEQALNVALALIESGQIDVVVLDSVAALVPEAELEGEIGRQSVALQARLMSQSLRKMTAAISKQRTAMIFINQIRKKVGVTFGSPDVTSGGEALKFYASTRIDLRRIASIKRGDEVIGNRVKARIAKNKVGRPWKQAEFEILHECGVNQIGEIIDLSARCGSLRRNGSRYYREETFLANGREACRKLLMTDQDLLDELKQEVMDELAKVLEEEHNRSHQASTDQDDPDQDDQTTPEDDDE